MKANNDNNQVKLVATITRGREKEREKNETKIDSSCYSFLLFI